MKNILIFILFVLIQNTAYSQFYFGADRIETKNQILKQETDVNITTDSAKNIQFICKEKETAFKILFNNDGLAYTNVLIPFNEKALNKWIKGFNDQYIVKSEKEWVHYSSGYVFEFKLVYHENLFMIIGIQKSISKAD